MSLDLVDPGPRRGLVVGDARLVGHLEDVEQVVRDAAAVGHRNLRGSDVHAPVQLHGVGVHDLGMPAPHGQRLSEVECEL